jgi:hypothetical protein
MAGGQARDEKIVSTSALDETEAPNGAEKPAHAASWNWQATVISMCAAAGITECDDIVISDVLEGIKSGRWREAVEQVRKTYARAYETAVKEANPDPHSGFRELLPPADSRSAQAQRS